MASRHDQRRRGGRGRHEESRRHDSGRGYYGSGWDRRGSQDEGYFGGSVSYGSGYDDSSYRGGRASYGGFDREDERGYRSNGPRYNDERDISGDLTGGGMFGGGIGGYTGGGSQGWTPGGMSSYGGANYGRSRRSEYDNDRGYNRFDRRESERGYYSGRNDRDDEDERGWLERAGDEVASWFGDEEAERRRRMDEQRDTYGRHRGRGPRNYTRSDERIREDINDRFTDNDYLDASEIEVEVSSGDITLSGTVDTRYEKRLAEDVAERVSGARNVENRIRVKQNIWSTDTQYGDRQTNMSTGSTSDIADTTGTSAATTEQTRGSAAGRR